MAKSAKTVSKAKKRLSKAHRKALSAAAKRRWANQKGRRNRKKAAKKTTGGRPPKRQLTLAQIEKLILQRKRTIKKWKKSLRVRLKVLRGLDAQVKTLGG